MQKRADTSDTAADGPTTLAWGSFAAFAGRRIRMLGVIGFVGFLATGLALSLVSERRSSIVHYVALKGFVNESYPSGSKFAPRDLLSQEVLQSLSERVGIPWERLQGAISVDYGSPQIAGLLRRFEAALAQRNLRPQEVDALNTQFANDLRAASQAGLRISVMVHLLGAGESKATEVAELLPKIWNEVYVSRFRGLDPTALIVSGLPDTAQNRTPADLVAADIAVTNMWNSLSLLESNSRLNAAVSAKGLATGELKAEVSRFRILWLSPLLSRAASAPESAPVFAAYLRELRLRQEEVQANIDVIDRTIDELQRNRGERSERSAPAAGAKPAETVQITDGAMRQMLDLYDRATNADYLRRMFDKRVLLVEERARIATAVDRISTPNAAAADQSPLDIEAVERRLHEIKADYRSLIESARGLLMRERGVFYNAIGGEPARRSFGTTLILFAALLAGFVLAAGVLALQYLGGRGK